MIGVSYLKLVKSYPLLSASKEYVFGVESGLQAICSQILLSGEEMPGQVSKLI